MGEFARSSAIARAVLERWPSAAVHFVLSRHAPYAQETAFPATLLPSSATFHSAAVIRLMRAWLPDVVIFDNAGRSAQLKAAHRLGARIVFISARRRHRRRAFRVAWMRLIDEHWIAYPKFLVGELGWLERLKLTLLRRPAIRYLDVILSRAAPPPKAANSAGDAGRCADVLVVPGGGTGHPGADGATEQFLIAARHLAASGFTTTFVGPRSHAPSGSETAKLSLVGMLPQSELAERMRGARLVVVNGGSTLLQAIACGAACVAAPIAGDQHDRVRRCAQAGVAVEAVLGAADLEAKARALLDDEPARAALAGRASGLALADGVEVAVDALDKLVQPT
jgi:hypothetical protein